LNNETRHSRRKTGCGIAAVATIVDKPYSEVKTRANILGIFADDEKLFSETDFVRKLLEEYEITSLDKKPFACWEALPDLALLATKYHEENGHPFWHWVVFHREKGQAAVLDSSTSLVENKRTDFDQIQIRAKWYIEVYKRRE
jgi:hypothetical protein